MLSSRKSVERGSRNLLEAFRRAECETRELQRLRAAHPQWSGLHFHPELLATEATEPAGE